MSKEREENNRRIANWLEPLSSLPNEDDSEEMQAYESDAWIATFRLSRVTGMHVPSWEPRDFYADEAANALVLEKMDRPMLFKNGHGVWVCRPNYCVAEYAPESPDRKTAIVMAALKLIESEEK